MAEILTESFCERCGTRYTFQAAAPSKQRLGRFRTLSKGLKNYVLSDETSLEEALADARSDVDRSVSSQQLEAFHQTFNFCMSCRQYTCANCWNEVEGRCLTCAPDLTHDILPQAFPQLDGLPARGGAMGGNLLNGHAHDAPNGHVASAAELAWPTTDLPPAAEPDVDAPIGLDEPLAQTAAPEPEAGPTEPAVEPEPPRLSFLQDRAPRTVDEEAAVAASQTVDLLARFRPGQSLDEAIAAFEAKAEVAGRDAAVASEPEPVAAAEPEPEFVAEPEPVAAAEPEPEPVAVAEPEPVAVAEPEPEFVAEPEPEFVAEPEPVAAAEPEPEPVAAAEPEPEPVAVDRPGESRREDRVEAPVWRIVAPDSTPDLVGAVAPPPVPAPDQPVQWPAPSAAAILSRVPGSSTEAMWAASGREVLAERPAQGVQSCVSCGLALSATARFCRRCGNRQS